MKRIKLDWKAVYSALNHCLIEAFSLENNLSTCWNLYVGVFVWKEELHSRIADNLSGVLMEHTDCGLFPLL